MKNYWQDIRELVDHQTFLTLGQKAWQLIDMRLLETLNQIKDAYGYTMVINTWFMQDWQRFGEMREFSCFRPNTSTVGKPDGAHYRGMGVDILFFDAGGNLINSDTIRQKLMADCAKFPWIRCLEIGISWVHIDVMDENNSPKRRGCNEKQIMLVDTKNFVSWFDRGTKQIRKAA